MTYGGKVCRLETSRNEAGAQSAQLAPAADYETVRPIQIDNALLLMATPFAEADERRLESPLSPVLLEKAT